jgi:hypothetical protein
VETTLEICSWIEEYIDVRGIDCEDLKQIEVVEYLPIARCLCTQLSFRLYSSREFFESIEVRHVYDLSLLNCSRYGSSSEEESD